MTLFAFIALGLAMLTLGLRTHWRCRQLPLGSVALAGLALGLAWHAGIITFSATALLLMQVALALWLSSVSAPRRL